MTSWADGLDDLAPYASLTTRWDGNVEQVNTTFLGWTGYRRDDVVGRMTLADLLSKAAAIFGQTHLRPLLLAEGQFHQVAVDVVRADRTRLSVLMNGVLDRDDDGTPRRIRVAMLDVSERRAYERELLLAKQAAEAAEAEAHRLATTLQATLIPPRPPAIDGLAVAAAYRPAGSGAEVGGDFYDVFRVSDDAWVVTVGDVCGKGADAAVVTALARYSLRAAAMENPSPAAAIEVLNQIVLAHETDRFLTVVVVRLQREGERWLVRLATGGHPEPLLVRDGAATPISAPGALVGVLDAVGARDVEVALGGSDTLVLYTDGITEGRRGCELFGDERLCAALAGAGRTASDLVEHLLAETLAFQHGLPRDDIAVVALQPTTSPRA